MTTKTRAQQIEDAAILCAAAMHELNKHMAKPFTDGEKLLQRIFDDALKQAQDAIKLPPDPRPLRYGLIEAAAAQALQDIRDMVGHVSCHSVELTDEQHPWFETAQRLSDALSLGEYDSCEDLLKDQGTAGPITMVHDTSGLRLDGAELDARELAAILAGLRIIQRNGVPEEVEDVATDGGTFNVLDDDDIDELCERINR